jgi:hypothetical protein
MIRRISAFVLLALLALSAGLALPARAQYFPTDDPVIRQIWEQGMENSQIHRLGQVLLDSIGPRLTGTPALEAGADWVVKMYESWGIQAEKEPYGTWNGWRRGITHIDLLEPRVRTLEGTMLAWSPGTSGPVQGAVVTLPRFTSPADLEAFLPQVQGKFVLVSPAEPTCRPDENWEEYATPESYERMSEERSEHRQAWRESLRSTGLRRRVLYRTLEESGALGIFTSSWPNGWGVREIFEAYTERVPTLDLSCEDYGLVFRLASNGQNPVLRVNAEAEDLGEVPTFNVIGRIPGAEVPDEYVLLSAHFDSWDGGSGATDNGTGTITMMEATRILKNVYPNPRRTILVGHWNSEEQGLNGSRAFAADHPEVVEGLQAVFNQDDGTGRVVRISMQGLAEAGASFGRWLGVLPPEITRHIDLEIPGRPGGGGSDYAAFICSGAPAFSLYSLSWDYGPYTWHTGRDTFDKVVLDEVKNNATLTAMLTYLASEEPSKMPRTRVALPISPRTGDQMTWPACRDAARTARNR